MYLVIEFGPSSNATPNWQKSWGWMIDLRNGNVLIFNKNNRKLEVISNIVENDLFDELVSYTNESLTNDIDKEMVENPEQISNDASGIKYKLIENLKDFLKDAKDKNFYLLAYSGDRKGHLNSKWAVILANKLEIMNSNFKQYFLKIKHVDLMSYLG